MAQVIITIKIMPENPGIDLDEIKVKAENIIKSFDGHVGKTEIEPVAFGLKSLNLTFVRDESLGGTDEMEEQVAKLDGVNSAEISDVRRAIG